MQAGGVRLKSSRGANRSEDRMSFFDTGGPDGLRPTADIDRVERSWTARTGEHHSAFVIMKGGRKIEVEDNVVDQILNVQAPLIAAQAGFFLLTFCYFPGLPDPGPWLEKDAVLAWRTSIYGALEPVIIRRYFEGMQDDHAILHPNGLVESRDRSYNSVEHWQTEMKDLVDAATMVAAQKDSTIQ